MQIETIGIDRLIPYTRNSRTHSDAQVAQIAEIGAGMYRGEKITRGKEQDAEHHSALGGATPTTTLHTPGGAEFPG